MSTEAKKDESESAKRCKINAKNIEEGAKIKPRK